MSAPLSQKLTAKQVRELYEDFYKDNGGLVEIDYKVPEISVSVHPETRVWCHERLTLSAPTVMKKML